jgi:hypothetical protein
VEPFRNFNGASLWLLGVAAAHQGDTHKNSLFSDVGPTYVQIITVRNGRLKFELIIIYFFKANYTSTVALCTDDMCEF